MAAAGGGDEEERAIVQAQRGQVDEAAPHGPPPRQPMALAGLERAEEPVEAHRPIPGVGHAGVALEALVEREALPLQPQEPRRADELPVGQPGGDPARAEDLEEAPHQGDARGGVGVARLVQHRPEHGQRDAPVDDAEHQEGDVGLTELPVRAIHRQPPGAVADGDEAHQQPGQGILVALERAEAALEALVVRFHFGLAAEAGGQLGQADAAHLQPGQQELGEEAAPRSVPRQVFGPDGFEFGGRVFRESSMGLKKQIAYLIAIKQLRFLSCT